MPCHYPIGDEKEWCERHQKDHAMVRALREEATMASQHTARIAKA